MTTHRRFDPKLRSTYPKSSLSLLDFIVFNTNFKFTRKRSQQFGSQIDLVGKHFHSGILFEKMVHVLGETLYIYLGPWKDSLLPLQ